MGRPKFDLKSMTHDEILSYIENLRKVVKTYKTMFRREQVKVQDLLLKYCPPVEKKPQVNHIEGFTVDFT